MSQKAIDVALKAAEQQKDRESTAKFAARLAASMRDLGPVDTMRHTILTHVAMEKYDRAIEDLKKYVESKSEYPQFVSRSARLVDFASDLILAVKAKRSFPGMHQLPMSKQQDLYDRAMQHFDELKVTVQRIEKLEYEARLEDIRSTVWVVRAVVYSCFVLVSIGILMELSKGVLPSALTLLDAVFGDVTNWTFDILGL